MPEAMPRGNPPSLATAPISAVEITADTLTGRGGFTLFSRYVCNNGLFPHLERLFGGLRKSAKGKPVSRLFHQVFCFLVDGTSRHLVSFDGLKADEGYARAIETEPGHMVSSHAVKRFFGAFAWGRLWLFRPGISRPWTCASSQDGSWTSGIPREAPRQW